MRPEITINNDAAPAKRYTQTHTKNPSAHINKFSVSMNSQCYGSFSQSSLLFSFSRLPPYPILSWPDPEQQQQQKPQPHVSTHFAKQPTVKYVIDSIRACAIRPSKRFLANPTRTNAHQPHSVASVVERVCVCVCAWIPWMPNNREEYHTTHHIAERDA